MSARFRPPAVQALTPQDGFVTVSLYRSRKIRNLPSLAFELKQLLAFCDARGVSRPVELASVTPRFPCRILLAERRHCESQERTGRLQLTCEDGPCFFEHQWRMGPPRLASPETLPGSSGPGQRQIGVALVGKKLSGKPLFMVTALHAEPGAGGEIVFGTAPSERGFTEERLRGFLAAAYGMSETEIARAVQTAKARADMAE